MSTEGQKAEGEYRIVVNSIQLVAATPLTRPVVHNEIAFYHGNNLVAAFNGDPMNRRTGEFVYPSLSNTDTLRVTIDDRHTRAQDSRNPYPQIASGVVFQGGQAQFIEHLHQATNAAHSINNSNVDYIMVSPVMTPQNSNSVVGSLLQAMNLKPPATMNGLHAPGAGRSLLPNDFRENSPPIDPTNQAALQGLVGRLESLREGAVQERVRRDPNPYAAGTQQDCIRQSGIDCNQLQTAGQLFDPARPTAEQKKDWSPGEEEPDKKPPAATPQRPAAGAPSGP